MGSYNFRDVASSDTFANPEDAYDSLCEEAVFEYGHNPYSGTIATTAGFEMFTDFPVKTKEDLLKAEEIILDRTNKWDVCECVRFGNQWVFIGWAAS